jgi:hypothetical protein
MANLREYGCSYTFSRSSAEASDAGLITAYEDINGGLHSITGGSWTPPSSGGGSSNVWPLNVTYKYYSATPVIDVKPGVSGHDTFTVSGAFGKTAWGASYNWGNITVKCTSASITDEIIRYVPPNNIMRLWEITLEGITEGATDPSGIQVKRLTAEYSTELNGNTDRTVSGRLVLLLNSTTPIRKVSLSGSGTAFPCPKQAGDDMSFFLLSGVTFAVTHVSTSRNIQESGNGGIAATLYDYNLTLEA